MGLVGAGVLGGREDTSGLEQLHQDDKVDMVRPRRVAARDLPAADNRGIINMFGRQRTHPKKESLRHELNAAMKNEQLKGHYAQGHNEHSQAQRGGLQLGTEVLAEEGLIVIHSDVSEAGGMRGMVTKVDTGVMGEICNITWENGRKGCYSNFLLRTVDHNRRHGPREEVPRPASRPGPAPYCMGGEGPWVRPRGLLPPPQRPPSLGNLQKLEGAAFGHGQDLQEIPGFPGPQK